MGVTTRDRRASCIGNALHVPSLLPNPVPSVDVADRQFLCLLYIGVGAGAVATETGWPTCGFITAGAVGALDIGAFGG